jgi:Matrixin/Protein of unknown function (DUF2510)
MAARRAGDRPEQPGEPGWYPDPWSATGDGERYFDGKRWGTNERPLGRHTTATIEPNPRTRRTRRAAGRDRRTIGAIVVFVALVAAVWAINRSRDTPPPDLRTLPQVSAGPTMPTDRPPPRAEAAKPLGAPAPVPAGAGKFEVEQEQPNAPGTPVAFDPCRPVHYVVNGAGAPTDGLALIKSALARVQTATGLQFVYDGPTAETPAKDRVAYQPERYDKSRWAPILIAWGQESTYPSLAGYMAGVTTPRPEYANSDQLELVTGQVVFDREQLSIAAVHDRGEVRAVMLHEFGHVVGLDHTADRRELMYSEAQFNVRDYGPGDLRGLAQLGTQQCFPEG